MAYSGLNEKPSLDLLEAWGYLKNSSCLILGTLPPPAGGVSTHLSRLLPLLDSENITYEVFDPNKKNKTGRNFWGLFLSLVKNKFSQIHIHSPSFKTLSAIFLARIFVKSELYFFAHNPIFFKNEGYLFNKLLDAIVARVQQINAVSEMAKLAILEDRPFLENKIFMHSSFLPPDISSIQTIKKTYPDSLIEFLEEHHPILIFNAYRLHFKDEIDVYGLDLCIELLIRLSERHPELGLIFALGKRNPRSDYLNSQLKRLQDRNLISQFHLLDNFQGLWALFDDCDIMIRPTLYDGYGISVSEALIMGCKVIASDCIKRQEGCIIFENRNIDDLEKVTLSLLSEFN